MIRKILIVLAILIGIASIGLNIVFFIQLKATLKPLEHNANRSIMVSRFFGFDGSDIANDSLNILFTHTQEESEFLVAVDKAINELLNLQNELVSVAGGRSPETGFFLNPGSTHYSYSYFFSENNFRNYGIEYFNQIISDYLRSVNRLNYPSHITLSLERHEKFNGGTLFDNITVAESMNFIELLKANIIIDKYVYLSTQHKRVPTPAK